MFHEQVHQYVYICTYVMSNFDENQNTAWKMCIKNNGLYFISKQILSHVLLMLFG